MRRHTLFDAPLLTQDEIAALLQAGTPASGVARRPPQHGHGGELLSPRPGAGSDFAEVRPYQPGDDPRHIDWRASARARAPLTRTWHAELNRPLCLLIDRGPSMRFGSRVRIKAAQAVRVAIRLAAAGLQQGRETAALLLDEQPHWLPAQRGMTGLQTLIEHANRPCPPLPAETGNRWSTHLSGLQQRLPGGSELVLISDFNLLAGEDQAALRHLGRHCDTRALHIVDPLECAWPVAVQAQAQWGAAVTAQAAQVAPLQQQWLTQLVEHFRLAAIDYRRLDSAHDLATEPSA